MAFAAGLIVWLLIGLVFFLVLWSLERYRRIEAEECYIELNTKFQNLINQMQSKAEIDFLIAMIEENEKE